MTPALAAAIDADRAARKAAADADLHLATVLRDTVAAEVPAGPAWEVDAGHGLAPQTAADSGSGTVWVSWSSRERAWIASSELPQYAGQHDTVRGALARLALDLRRNARRYRGDRARQADEMAAEIEAWLR